MWNSVKNKYPLTYANIHPCETHSFLWFIELGLLVSIWQESVFCQWLLLISKGQEARGFANGLINESQRRDGHVIGFIEDADIRMRILCLNSVGKLHLFFFLASHSWIHMRVMHCHILAKALLQISTSFLFSVSILWRHLRREETSLSQWSLHHVFLLSLGNFFYLSLITVFILFCTFICLVVFIYFKWFGPTKLSNLRGAYAEGTKGSKLESLRYIGGKISGPGFTPRVFIQVWLPTCSNTWHI